MFIEGRLQLESWEDKQSGQKRSRLRVVAENLQLLGDKERAASPSREAPAAAQNPQVPQAPWQPRAGSLRASSTTYRGAHAGLRYRSVLIVKILVSVTRSTIVLPHTRLIVYRAKLTSPIRLT